MRVRRGRLALPALRSRHQGFRSDLSRVCLTNHSTPLLTKKSPYAHVTKMTHHKTDHILPTEYGNGGPSTERSSAA